MWLPISVAGEDERFVVSTTVEGADEDDDGSLLASMEISSFGTMRQPWLSVPCMLALRPLTRAVC